MYLKLLGYFIAFFYLSIIIMEVTNELKVNNSSLIFKGSNISELILNDTKVISNKSESCTNPLLNGCYLMYPWTGRLSSTLPIEKIMNSNTINYPFKDSNGYPLHGFFQAADREVVDKGDSYITFQSKDQSLFKYFPRFVETYSLNEKSLLITIQFENITDYVQYFAFGYHPYIGINDKKVDDLTITSNIDTKCILSSELVPVMSSDGNLETQPCKFQECKIGEKELDDLFKSNLENPFVRLSDGEIGVTIVSEGDIKLPFIQFYTPPDRERLAIEPMSSPSNAFNIGFSDYLVKINPGEMLESRIKITLE
jgi:galactose mutarotase-like enzyme